MNKSCKLLLESGGLWGRLSFVLSLLACYGTLALLALAPTLGIALAIDEGLWADAILAFAWAAAASITLGVRVHGFARPAIIALAGAGLLSYTLLLDYLPAFEIGAFAILAVACVDDYRRRRAATKRPRAVDGDIAQTR